MIEHLPVYERKKSRDTHRLLLWKDMDEMPRDSFWAILKGHVSALWCMVSCQLYSDFFFFLK